MNRFVKDEQCPDSGVAKQGYFRWRNWNYSAGTGVSMPRAYPSLFLGDGAVSTCILGQGLAHTLNAQAPSGQVIGPTDYLQKRPAGDVRR